MSRFNYADPLSYTPEVKEFIERAGNLNILRLIANGAPAVLEAFARMSYALTIESKADFQLREVAILRVAKRSNGCKYEIFHHAPVAGMVGVTPEQIEEILGDGSLGTLTDAQLAVVRFVDSIITDTRASDESLANLRLVMEDSHIFDLMILIGFYRLVAGVAETTDVVNDGSASNQDQISKGLAKEADGTAKPIWK